MGKKVIYQDMMLPLDGSKEAEKSLDDVIPLLKATKGELLLLHVIELFSLFEKDREAEYRILIEKAEEYLNKIKARVESEGIVAKTVIGTGKAAVEICKHAERDDVDIVLISPHGAGGILDWAIGSVAEKVVRHSPKPVLVIRQPAS